MKEAGQKTVPGRRLVFCHLAGSIAAPMNFPADAPDSLRAGRRRWQLVGQNAGAQILSRLVSGLCQLAFVPLLLHRLGTDTFGWVMAAVACVALSQFADLGVAMALQQNLSEAWARRDFAAAQHTYVAGARLLLLLGAAWFVVAGPLAWWIGRLAPAPDARGFALDSPLACLLIALTACVGVPLSAGPRLAAAVQLGWIHAGWTAAANVLTLLAAVAWSRSANASAATVVALLCAGQLAPGLATALHLARRLAWPAAPAASRDEMRRLWRAGLPFAAPNLAGAALQALTPLAFARFGGYGASAAFAVLQRLFGVAQQGHALLLGPLWPAYADAATRGDHAWVRRTLRLSLIFTAATCAAVAAGTFALPLILAAWLGDRAPTISPAFAWLVAAWAIASMFNQALSFLLLGLGKLSAIAGLIALSHLLTLAALALLGSQFGGTGVAAAIAAGATLGTLPLLARASLAALRIGPADSAAVR